MMAVSSHAGVFNNLHGNTGNANEGICSFGSEDCFQTISKEDMAQIRKIMIHHEEIFKEQVHALHKLYKKQKSAMQEIRKAIYYPQAPVLAFNSDSSLSRNIQPRNLVMEGKPLRLDCVTSQDYRQVHVLSQQTFWAGKEITGWDPRTSLSMNNTDFRTLPSVTNKPRREIEIDLERPPEDYMVDTDIQAEVNGHRIQDASTHLSEETLKANQDSHVGSNFLSALQTSSPYPNQIDASPPSVTLAEPRQVTRQEASETGIAEVDATMISSCVQNLNESSKNSELKDFLCNHLPALGNSSVHDESNPSPSQDTEKPSWLYQGGSESATQRLKSNHSCEAKHQKEITSDHVKEGSNPVSTKLCQTLQSSSIHAECDLKRINDVCAERSTFQELACQACDSGGNENPDCVVPGSNVKDYQGGDILKGGGSGSGISKMKSDLTFETNSSDPVRMSKVAVEGVQPETEAHHFTNADIEPSLSSSIPGYELNQSPENLATQQDSVTATESHNVTENETTLEEARESIAAQILLSFAPGRSHKGTKGNGYQTQQTKAESNGLNIDAAAGHERKRSLRTRHITYSDGNFMNGSEKLSNFLHARRRRTIRRPR